MRNLLRSFAWVLVLLAISGCEPEIPEPDASAEIEPGVRIVSLSPAASKILVDLGVGELVVGRHNYDRAVPAGVPPVGDQSAIDYETLLGLRPTHVVIQSDAGEPPARLTEIAASSGFEVMDVEVLSLFDVEIATLALEMRFAPGAGLAQRLHEALEERAEDRAAWGRVLVAMQTSPTVDILGPGSAHHELIERLGYEPAAAEGLPYMPTDAEDVLAMDPGVIVLVMPRSPGAPSAPADWSPTAEQLGSLAGLGLGAVEAGRVVIVDDPLALVPSTSLIGVAAELERRLAALGPLGSGHDDADAPTRESARETGPG